MSFNYCGPYWSEGKLQSSVVGTLPPRNDLDYECQQHDAVYALEGDKKQADLTFMGNTLGYGPLSTIYGVIVGLQGLLRTGGDGTEDFLQNYGTLHSVVAPNSVNLANPMKNPTLKQIKKNALKPNPRNPRGRKTGTARLADGVVGSVVTPPAALGPIVRNTKARFRASPNGGTLVHHKEYLAAISNSTTFTNVAYPVNPGIVTTFPWLMEIANSYDRYRFRRLKFTYVPSAATSSTGRLTMAFNYNAGDPAPVTKQQIFSIIPNNESAVWCPIELDVPCDATIYYTRNKIVTGQDIKTFDMGRLHIATDLGANTNTIGEVYVEYEVELMKPHPNLLDFSQIYSTSSTVTVPFPAGSTEVGAGYVTRSTDTNYDVAFTASGTYLVLIKIVGTVVVGVTSTTVSGAVITDVADGKYQIANAGATEGVVIYLWNVLLSDPNVPALVNFVFNATTITSTVLSTATCDPSVQFQITA